MRVLILDDMQGRHDVFAKLYQKHDRSHVFRYSEFCQELQKDWDLIHLDHDLAEHAERPESYLDGWGNHQFFNGGHCVQRIIEKYAESKDKPKIMIHSINSVGAKNMLSDLLKAGFIARWEPFGDVWKQLGEI